MNKIQEFKIPEEVAAISLGLESAGFEAYLIGGCVRDLLIGLKPKDWDITTNAVPEQIIKTFPKTFYENEYGTVGVVNENATDETTKIVEVTPYRTDSKYSNKRHPDSVEFSQNIDDDLQRRDFTVNAIALRIESRIKPGLFKGHLKDNYSGLKDIAEKALVTVGNPQDRFSEDALRMLRAVRLSAELGFTINTEVRKAILSNAGTLEHISAERIRDEFIRIVMSSRPMQGLDDCKELGLLSHIIPELDQAKGVQQNQAHAYDVYEHLLRTVQHSADKNYPLEVRLASIFHDIGKPTAARWSDEKKEWTFYGHDVVGARMTEKILKRLVFPKKVIDEVVKYVRWHMFFSDTDQITLSSVRRLLTNVGRENIWNLMDLRACDRIGTGRPKENPYRLRKFKSMIEEVMHDPVTVGMLKINGNDIIKVAKVQPGPKIGHILHALLEEVLENPRLNTVSHLTQRAEELAKLDEKTLFSLGEKGRDKKDSTEEKALKEIRGRYWVK